MSLWAYLCIGISCGMVALLIVCLIMSIYMRKLKRKKEIEMAKKCPYEINIYD